MSKATGLNSNNDHCIDSNAICMSVKKKHSFIVCKSNFNTDDPSLCVCVSVCVCLFVCVSLASDFSETVEVIIVKLGTVTASDVTMHHIYFFFILSEVIQQSARICR